MARVATAIYIDDTSVKVLTLNGKRPQIWVSAELERGLVRDGLILDREAVAKVVRKVWGEGFTGNRVVAGISGINCLYRNLTLPRLPKDVLPEAVRREAGRVLGVPVEQLYISWQPMPSSPDETRVFLVAASQDAVDALVATLRKAGLNPYLIDIRPLALARAIPQESAILLDVQDSSLDVVVKVGRHPEVMRSVALGRTRSAEDSTSLGRQEVDRAVSFYNSVHADAPLAGEVPLLVSGTIAAREDLWAQLEDGLGRKVEALELPVESRTDFDAHIYATNIGLAFKETADRSGTGYSVININVLPERYRPKPRPLSELLLPPAMLVGALAVAFVGYLAINARSHTAALREELEVTNELVVSVGTKGSEELKRLEDTVAGLETEVGAKERRVDALSSQLRYMEVRQDDVNMDLGQLNATPAGIDLRLIKYEGDRVLVSGWGEGESPVFSYARTLRESGHFHSVMLTKLNKEGTRMAFELTLFN